MRPNQLYIFIAVPETILVNEADSSRLQNKVIDFEVAASTPSPTIDPTVHTVLLGHSMGGIVAAEALLAIAADMPIPSSPTASRRPNEPTSPSFIFPHVIGILAFDTPYLGINPRVIAHGAETHYKTASTAWSAVSEVASALGYGASKGASKGATTPAAAPAAASSPQKLIGASEDYDAAATPAYQRLGKYAMFAGAAGAVVAGGAAAYMKRDTIGESWGWVGSHLEFVNCLARPEELRRRVEKVRQLQEQSANTRPQTVANSAKNPSATQRNSIGFTNLVTLLAMGAGAAPDVRETSPGAPKNANIEPEDLYVHVDKNDERGLRTFCNLPPCSAKFF